MNDRLKAMEVKVANLETQLAAQQKWFVNTLYLARPFLPDPFVAEVSAVYGPMLHPAQARLEPGEPFQPLAAHDAGLVEAIRYAVEGD
jgi:hypothetical protein